MPTWFEASVPVMLAALLAALGALFLELRDHRDRLIELKTKMDGLPCVRGDVRCVPRT